MITEIDLPDAAFGNMAPYQWAGSTDFDISYDECGLWVIYATLQNSLDIGPDTNIQKTAIVRRLFLLKSARLRIRYLYIKLFQN